MKRVITSFALCLLLLLPLSAWSADVVSTWRHQNKTSMTLAMRDVNHIRMDTGKDSYILVNAEKVYMISRQDGKWTAMDMDVLAGMMNQFGIRAGTTPPQETDYQSTFKKTGRTETVAGYQGDVYAVETKDQSGQLIDRSEVVFSTHADVKLASKAWMNIASRMGDIVGAQTSRDIETAAKQAPYGGMLRVGEMALVSIEKPSLDATYFDLPKGAEIVDMDTIGSHGEQAGNEARDAGLEELGEAAAQDAQEQTEPDAIEEVKKGVDGLFKKIFN